MELEQVVAENSKSIKELTKLVHDLTTDTKVFIAQQTEVNSRMEENYATATAFHTDFKNQLSNLQSQFKLKQNIIDTLGKNWWKILAFMLPCLGALGELMIYLRNLPPAS